MQLSVPVDVVLKLTVVGVVQHQHGGLVPLVVIRHRVRQLVGGIPKHLQTAVTYEAMQSCQLTRQRGDRYSQNGRLSLNCGVCHSTVNYLLPRNNIQIANHGQERQRGMDNTLTHCHDNTSVHHCDRITPGVRKRLHNTSKATQKRRHVALRSTLTGLIPTYRL